MSLQLVRIVPFLSFLSIVSAETHLSTSSPSFSVIQTPLFLNVSEGSDVTLSCNMEGNVSSKWFVNWMKMGKKIKNSNRTFVTTNNVNKSSILTLKSTVIADSGTYCCVIGDSGHSQSGNTSVIIWEKPYMVVRQTPVEISKKAGANVTITCNFNRVDLSLLEVKWYKDTQELRNPKHTEKSKQKALLKLVNVNLEDSGNYVCSIRIRNRTGSGNGTQVHVTAERKKPSQTIEVNGDNRQPGSPQENTGGGIVIPVVTGVVVGTLVFLLLLGAMVWRSKKKNKGASENPSEVEPDASKEDRKHASLTKQMSEVTYADIRFHKREVLPDAEVVYAEVRMDTKRPERRDRGTQPAGLH